MSDHNKTDLEYPIYLVAILISRVSFFFNGRYIDSYCLNDSEKNALKFFNMEKIRIFSFANTNKYLTTYCENIFFNSHVHRLIVNGFSKSFISHNYFNFKKENNNISLSNDLNSKINVFLIDAFYVNIDSSILNENVFMNTKSIIIHGIIEIFDTRFLNRLENLGKAFFSVVNTKKFLYKNQNFFQNINAHYKDKSKYGKVFLLDFISTKL